MARRGAKVNKAKNNQAHREWKEAKKAGRPKQRWIPAGSTLSDGVVSESGTWVKA